MLLLIPRLKLADTSIASRGPKSWVTLLAKISFGLGHSSVELVQESRQLSIAVSAMGSSQTTVRHQSHLKLVVWNAPIELHFGSRQLQGILRHYASDCPNGRKPFGQSNHSTNDETVAFGLVWKYYNYILIKSLPTSLWEQ